MATYRVQCTAAAKAARVVTVVRKNAEFQYRLLVGYQVEGLNKIALHRKYYADLATGGASSPQSVYNIVTRAAKQLDLTLRTRRPGRPRKKSPSI